MDYKTGPTYISVKINISPNFFSFSYMAGISKDYSPPTLSLTVSAYFVAIFYCVRPGLRPKARSHAY